MSSFGLKILKHNHSRPQYLGPNFFFELLVIRERQCVNKEKKKHRNPMKKYLTGKGDEKEKD